MTDQTTNEHDEFLEAAGLGQYERVIALLNQGLEADVKDESGATALMHAVKGEHLETVRLLIERGANRNAKGKYLGFNPIVFAVKASNADILELLLNDNREAALADLQFAFGVAQLLKNQRVMELLKQAIARKSD
ncbi:MAG: ankyrin repeat domain-containing protein [Acidobacteriota bacterium]